MIAGAMYNGEGTCVFPCIWKTSTSLERLSGLLSMPKLASDEGLLIDNCRSVHTFFMNYAIDLVYLDKVGTIKKLVVDVSPWNISACFSSSMTLELPSGQINRSGLKNNMSLIWKQEK